MNEEGTEAAGATGVEIVAKAIMSYLVFWTDRPFLFIIRENETGTVLFMGRMVDPRGK